MTAALAVGMLAVGVGVGAAVGPAPTASFAGDTPALIAKLISELAAARSHSSPPASTQPAAETPAETPLSSTPVAAPASTTTTATTPATSASGSEPEAEKPSKTKSPTTTSKVPAVTDVWLIELSGPSYEELLTQKSAAPYISGQLIPTGHAAERLVGDRGQRVRQRGRAGGARERSIDAGDRAHRRPAPVPGRSRG